MSPEAKALPHYTGKGNEQESRSMLSVEGYTAFQLPPSARSL